MFLKSRAGAAKLGTPLMILCFLAMGGFLYWLSITAEPTMIVVEEVSDTELGNAIAFADFSAATDSYMGEEISLEDIEVTSLLGPHCFWTSLADGTPYLLHFTEVVLGDSVSLAQGSSATITGTVMAMSDSILEVWEAAGAFPQGEPERMQAEFAESFIEVSSIATDEAESGEASDPSS